MQGENEMELINENDVVFDLNVATQKETLRVLAEMAYKNGNVDDGETFYQELCKREEESTTGFGNGIAIPHARHACVKKAGILFVRCAQDIEWNSIDGEPVQACVCLIAPDDKNDFHLKTLSKFARRLIHEEFVDLLKNADKETVLAEINEIIK